MSAMAFKIKGRNRFGTSKVHLFENATELFKYTKLHHDRSVIRNCITIVQEYETVSGTFIYSKLQRNSSKIRILRENSFTIRICILGYTALSCARPRGLAPRLIAQLSRLTLPAFVCRRSVDFYSFFVIAIRDLRCSAAGPWRLA